MPRLTPSSTVSPGFTFASCARSSAIVGVDTPFTDDDHVGGAQLADRVAPAVERGDDDAARTRDDLVAEALAARRRPATRCEIDISRRSAWRTALSLTPGGTISFAGTSVAPSWIHGKSDSNMLARRSNTSTK